MSEVIVPAAMTLVSTTAVDSEPEWSAATSYGIGIRVKVDADGLIYESLAASNQGKVPKDSPTQWQKIRPTNKRTPFGDSYRTKATRAGSLNYVISTATFTDRVALLNLSGSLATVTATKDGATVYSRPFSLLNDSPIQDLWTYFYEPIVYIRDLIVDDIPTTSGLTYSLTISGPTAELALIRIGRGKFIGDAEEGSGVSTTRYSLPNFDEYGNYTPVKRRSAKRGSFDMVLPSSQVDAIKDFFDDLDITPIVFNMTASFTRGKIWGFARSTDYTWFKYGIDKYRLEIEGIP